MAKIRVLGESPPPPRGSSEEQLRDLRDYLTRLKDELEFLLTHLGADNMDSAMLVSLKRIGWIEEEADQTAGDIGTIQEQITGINGEIEDINTALAGKQDTLTFDNAPTSGSGNPVKSGGVFTALAGKQGTLTFDDSPTASSSNPVKSGGVYTALSGKQDTLTFDNSPTSGSNNPVKSGGVYSALATEIMILDFGTISSLPVTKSNAAIKADHVVLAYELGTPGAQTGDWTITTSAGSVSVSGTIVGSTTLKLVLGLPGTSIS